MASARRRADVNHIRIARVGYRPTARFAITLADVPDPDWIPTRREIGLTFDHRGWTITAWMTIADSIRQRRIWMATVTPPGADRPTGIMNSNDYDSVLERARESIDERIDATR